MAELMVMVYMKMILPPIEDNLRITISMEKELKKDMDFISKEDINLMKKHKGQ